jgi:hypothetical protein
MGLRAEPSHLLTSQVTNIVLRTDKGGWTPGSPGRPSFSITGAAGDSIADQVILDSFTAVIAIKSALSNGTLVITDTINNEAASIAVWPASVFAAEKRQAVSASSPTAEGRHNRSER